MLFVSCFEIVHLLRFDLMLDDVSVKQCAAAYNTTAEHVTSAWPPLGSVLETNPIQSVPSPEDEEIPKYSPA